MKWDTFSTTVYTVKNKEGGVRGDTRTLRNVALGACGQAECVDLLDSGTVEQTHLKFTQNSQTDLDRHILIEGGISASSFKM